MNNGIRKIGIMGGTFDPPHLGHLISAENVRKSLSLDRVIFIPTGNIYYKDTKETSAAKKRMEMVRLAISKNPGFSVSDIEVKREGYSYTCDTLEELKELYSDSELYFIVGADSLDYMEKWKNPERIFALSKIVVIERKGFSKKENREKAQELKSRYNGEIILLDMEQIDISSTEIRNAVKRNKPIDHMVTEEVMDYVLKNNLYKNGDTNDGD